MDQPADQVAPPSVDLAAINLWSFVPSASRDACHAAISVGDAAAAAAAAAAAVAVVDVEVEVDVDVVAPASSSSEGTAATVAMCV